ncbi:hypothetical protein [Sphingomicrobium astaxanthinifaciens]|uniref:hypothetical protein n=1 Tax=Sphingomicrobium astaxanthinifaciens TaxID=1227949 RepID=UPI001FCC14A3|nr:hypothetical protein [Sphingomicrobium astaxanthinifaciens]MCJ7421441.1 hypothetical protein [Sphingomicrobium astaxanthinifaciens]
MYAQQQQTDRGSEAAIADRRMQVRAYNYWYSLLDGRDFPSIDDLRPADLQHFAVNSVLMDFSRGTDDPTLPYIGQAVRAQCGVGESVERLSEVPRHSMLGVVADHYARLMECRAPVGFESEGPEEVGDGPLYRGILMPFSSDDRTIDFVYAVINWKTAEQRAAETAARREAEAEATGALEDLDAPAPVPHGEPASLDPAEPAPVAATPHDDAGNAATAAYASAADWTDGPDSAVEAATEDPAAAPVDADAPGVVAFAPALPDDEEAASFARVDDMPTDAAEAETAAAGDAPAEAEPADGGADYAALAAVELPDDMGDAGEQDAGDETGGDYAELTGSFARMERPDPLADMDEAADGDILELAPEAQVEVDPFDAAAPGEDTADAAGADDGDSDEGHWGEAPTPTAPVLDTAVDEPEPTATIDPAAIDADTGPEPETDAADGVDAQDALAATLAVPLAPTDAADEAEDAHEPDPQAAEEADAATADVLAAEADTDADADADDDADDPSPLETWLEAAREAAALSNDADSRSRAALYKALGQAYDFSLVAEAEPDHYAALLEAADLTVQARAPMTPIVKLVFGIDYDKTRLTEFAAALSYGHRKGIAQGDFEAFVSEAEGGLKGLVAAERALKRGEEARAPAGNARLEAACRRLRERDAIDLARLGANEEFALVLVRRDDNGAHAPVARVIDHKLVERAILKSGR